MNLDILRKEVKKRVSEKRFSHILGVENCAYRLALKLIPDKLEFIRAAALLHDVTKEMRTEGQIQLLTENGIPLTEEDLSTPGVLHSFTAPIIIRNDFPDFAKSDILSAVEKHTLGGCDMSIFDKIIFISDYVEETRKYESCIKVRNMIFDNFENLSYEQALLRLDDACLMSIEEAQIALSKEGKVINSRMDKTKISLLKNKL